MRGSCRTQVCDVHCSGKVAGKRQLCASDQTAVPSSATPPSASAIAASPADTRATGSMTPARTPRSHQALPKRATQISPARHPSSAASTSKPCKVAAAAAGK